LTTPERLTAREQDIARRIGELAEQLGHMPVHGEFVAAGLKPLYSAASNGRGMAFYARLLGYKLAVASTAGVHWTDERLLHELQALAEAVNRVPVRGDFVEVGSDSLYHALTSHEHGYGHFARCLRLPPSPLSRANGPYWTHERVEAELLDFLSEHGLRRIPTAAFFRDHARTTLHRAVRSTGGIKRWHERVAGADFQRALRAREQDAA